MLFKNVAGQGLYIYAHDTLTDSPKTGDAANITATLSNDGSTPGSATATAHPTEIGGGVYWFPLSQAETDCDAMALYCASSTSGVQIDPVIVLTQAGAIPKVAAGEEGGLAVLPAGLKLPVTLAAADISNGPVPAIFTYALDCPIGLVITGPAWAGTFDVAGVRNGRPYFQRRGQYESTDYYVTWDGTDTWEIGTTLGGPETGYSLTSPTPVAMFSKPDATITAPATVSYNEGVGGSHVSPQHVYLAVYAYKTVDGETIYSAAAGSDQYVASETGVSIEWSWDAVSGAEGYVIHATIDAYDVGETHYNQWDYWEDVGGVTYRTFTDAYSPAGNAAIDVSNTTVTYVNAVPAVIAIAANTTQVKGTDADTAITARVDASTAATNVGTILGKLAGITLLAKWLRGLFRKDTMDATAKAEVNLGDGAFDEATDSLQGIRDTEPLGTAMRGTDSAALATTALSNLVWTDAKAGYLNAAVDSRMATFSYTAPPDAATVASATASAILETPANKLATNASGQVSASNLPTDQQTDIATALTKALRWLRILGRKDAAPAAQLTEYNAADDSWAATGTFDNTTDSGQAIADDVPAQLSFTIDTDTIHVE